MSSDDTLEHPIKGYVDIAGLKLFDESIYPYIHISMTFARRGLVGREAVFLGNGSLVSITYFVSFCEFSPLT